jgi:hypothetical protein
MGFKAKATQAKKAEGKVKVKKRRKKEKIAPKKPCLPNECSGCCGPPPKDPFTML